MEAVLIVDEVVDTRIRNKEPGILSRLDIEKLKKRTEKKIKSCFLERDSYLGTEERKEFLLTCLVGKF